MHVGAIVYHRYLSKFAVLNTRLQFLLKVSSLVTVQQPTDHHIHSYTPLNSFKASLFSSSKTLHNLLTQSET